MRRVWLARLIKYPCNSHFARTRPLQRYSFHHILRPQVLPTKFFQPSSSTSQGSSTTRGSSTTQGSSTQVLPLRKVTPLREVLPPPKVLPLPRFFHYQRSSTTQGCSTRLALRCLHACARTTFNTYGPERSSVSRSAI